MERITTICFDRNLPAASTERLASHAYNVANIQGSSQAAVSLFPQHIDLDIELDPARRVAQIHEGGFPHIAPAHNAACHRNLFPLILFLKVLHNLLCVLFRVKGSVFVGVFPLVLQVF